MNKMVDREIVITVTNDVSNDRRMLRIAESLIQAGNEVTIVGRYFHGKKRERFDDIEIRRIKCFFNTGFVFYAEYNLRLLLWLMFRRVDLLYAVDLDTIMPCGIVALIRQKPWIFDSHEYFTEVPELEGKDLVKSIWSTIGRLFVKRADLRITVGESLSDVLSQKYKSDFNVVRNTGRLYERGLHRPIKETIELVYLGVLNQGRGLMQLITTIKQIPNVRLTLMGDGDIRSQLEHLVEEKDLTDRVEFRGTVAADRVLRELSEFDIGVNLLEAISDSYRLSLANKFFDYVQAELPSVQMNFIEYRSINEIYNVSILIDNLSEAAISDAIEQLSNSPERYNTMVENCVKAKRHLCWEVEEKRLLEMIESMKVGK